VVGFIVWRNLEAPPQSSQETEEIVFEVQARYMVGGASLFRGQEKLLLERASDLSRGSTGQRLRAAVLSGELVGPDEALQRLKQWQQEVAEGKLPATDEQKRSAALLERLYRDYQDGKGPDALPPAQRAQLQEQLGWFGELALAPASLGDSAQRQQVLAPARRTTFGLVGYLLVMVLLIGLGFISLLTVFVLWLLGKLRTGVRTGSPYGGIYAETFALYLALFVAEGLALRLVGVPPDLRLLFSGLAALGGLLALIWPVLRGVPWRQVRADIGWTTGRHPALEILYGLGCYVAALPLVAGGLLVYLLITHIQGRLGVSVEQPNHPLVGWIAHSGWWVRIQAVLDACVVAPLVEETMFRGVLFRHLREATRSWLPVLSVLASAAVVSIVFAIIHPQGVLFVPVLGALAFAFCLARQWRGSLLAPMVAHGLQNTVTLLLVLLMMG
jgi:membrane protease YdiL (CAAX protease family)